MPLSKSDEKALHETTVFKAILILFIPLFDS